MNQVVVTEKERVELRSVDMPGELGPREVRGRTITSLISPGTEINYFYSGRSFPSYPGYASVFAVESCGSEVQEAGAGELLLCMGPHKSVQQVEVSETVAIPEGLSPFKAVIARLMGVAMTTLMTTKARPGEKVLITGAGPVGYLAAHMFKRSGYEVQVSEPNERRRGNLIASGIQSVFARIPQGQSDGVDDVALVLECSGHEQAAFDACRILRKGGELVLIGVPWRKQTELCMHELLHAVFHRYILLRSGWEWELPLHGGDFRPCSIFGGLKTALGWLQDGSVPVEDLISLHSPKDAPALYGSIHTGDSREFFSEFSWME